MLKHLGGALIVSLFIVGCATSRNYAPEMDSLNVKVANLQKQVQAKNKEIGSLQDQVRSLQQKVDAVEQAKRDAEIRLDAALSKLSRRGKKNAAGEYIK